MNFKVTYLDSIPPIKPYRYPKNSIQNIIEEFIKTDKPAMRIDFEDHYANPDVARATWHNAIKRSGHNLRLIVNSDEKCLYLVKCNE